MTKTGKKLVIRATMCSAMAIMCAVTPLHAQVAADAPEPGEIVVTARKRSEDVLKTPVAVSVVTSEDIAKKGITSVADLAANTPGMNINNNSSGRADRSFQQIIIRGFTPSTSLSTTVSTFIDGAPVSSPTALTSITDPARIEVLKGPQSAYFGRNTFAGAVNVVNKEPTGEWHGSLLAMGGTRNNYRLHADLEGPIFGEALTFRVAGDKFSKSGSYINKYDGGSLGTVRTRTLGDQSSKSVNGLLVAKPIDGLTIKAFGLYSEDNDGPAAQGLISAVGYSVGGRTITANQSNCTLNAVQSGTIGSAGASIRVNRPSICGVAPKLSAQAPSQNNELTPNIKNWLAKSTGRILDPKDGTQDFGLFRRYYHAHLAIDYDIADTGLTVSSITSMNREAYSTFVDLDNFGSNAVPNTAAAAAGGAPYWTYPYLVERKNSDFSQEGRLTFDNGGPLRATIGASYLNNWVTADLGGGTGDLTNVVASTSGETRSRTKGAFFALSYKFFDALTINAEGRYQIDKLYAYAQPTGVTITNAAIATPGFYAYGDTLISATYKNFLPRIIGQYDIDRNTMVYASWSKGVNPGAFNTGFLTSPPATVAAAIAAGIGIAVRPEKVTNYEIGLKGKLLDGRIRYALDGYFAQWRDQINTIALASLDPNTGTPQLVQGTANTGNVDMKGIEFEGSFAVNDLITINGAGALNDSKIKDYVSPTVSQLSGLFDYSGKQMPNTSKWSASAGIQFGGAIRGQDASTWFARADYVYKSGVYSNAANIVRTPKFYNVNARAGVTIDKLSIEAFVTNVFNNDAYTSIADNYQFTPNFAFTSTHSALIVGLREKRTAGVQAKLSF
ncbi:TonB-dependent receptor [Sphingobium sp.]|uniref:TonB-dependent receptor n=1 Tax=Sphingobium sp. TaxID=1912891 RepID=UPI003BB58C08